MVILGIDPGLAIVGFGVIEKGKFNTEVIDYGVITTPKEDTLPIRLEKIYNAMCALIDKYKPEQVAIEELFFNTNTTTGIAVAEARGVILLACIHKNLKLYEYTPLQVKQSVIVDLADVGHHCRHRKALVAAHKSEYQPKQRLAEPLGHKSVEGEIHHVIRQNGFVLYAAAYILPLDH